MKKTVLFSVIFLIVCLFLLNGCGDGRYSDAIKLNQKYISLVKTYIADMDKVNNAKDAANAMNRFADGLEKIWPQMKKLSEKYPELKDKNNTPEELKPSQKEADAISEKMGNTFMKLMPYMEDPDVIKAQERLSAAMKN